MLQARSSVVAVPSCVTAAACMVLHALSKLSRNLACSFLRVWCSDALPTCLLSLLRVALSAVRESQSHDRQHACYSSESAGCAHATVLFLQLCRQWLDGLQDVLLGGLEGAPGLGLDP